MMFKLLTATAVLIAAIASPAAAMGPHARSEAVQQRQLEARAYQYGPSYHGPYYRGPHTAPVSGFWPGDVAAAVVGGAIGTAGAIATAPFRYDAYAYNDYPGPYPYSGFACQPGTTFIGADGLRHICQ